MQCERRTEASTKATLCASSDPTPVKVGNRRASARSGHETHWREGGSKRANLLKGDIIETQNSNDYVHRHRQNS